jgi:hypothetical protein
VHEVNKQVQSKFKTKQVKPTQLIKSQKIKKWKEKSKQDAKRQVRVHARQQKVKKGTISFKAQHKHKGTGGAKGGAKGGSKKNSHSKHK